MIRPYEYLRLVLDPVRLAVLGASASGPVDAAALAERLGVDERKVLGATGKLREAGLLTDDLRLDEGPLRELAETIAVAEDEPPDVDEGEWSDEERRIIGRFVSGRTLTEIPVNRSKRRVVLERLAMEFEPGMRYEEPEVNVILREWHNDHATLRRYLVDEGLLTREGGVYWRTGGRI